MNRTLNSLYIPATYLVTSGLGFLILPDLTLKLLFFQGEYDRVFVSLTGLFLLGLALLVIQTIRLKIVALYPTLIGVRYFFCAMYVVLYLQTRNPIFIVFLGIVGTGVLISSISYARDTR